MICILMNIYLDCIITCLAFDKLISAVQASGGQEHVCLLKIFNQIGDKIFCGADQRIAC